MHSLSIRSAKVNAEWSISFELHETVAEMSTVIRVRNVGKRYFIGHQNRQADSLREALNAKLRNLFVRSNDTQDLEEFWALKDVSFEVEQGERLGIIGANGAGKSTLLKILSRVTEPTEGEVALKGRVSSLLEVNTGFHPQLTGRENIFLKGVIQGMTRQQIRKKFDEIVDFSGVEKFIDVPVKWYSSGMYARLGFAVTAFQDPEIMILDEVLAVGDARFQKKCLDKMEQAAHEGRTILFVSHSMEWISTLCPRAIHLTEGRITYEGDVEPVVDSYNMEITGTALRFGQSDLSDVERYGTGTARFQRIDAKAIKPDGTPDDVLRPGHDLVVEVEIAAIASLTDVNVAVMIFNPAGQRIIDANMYMQDDALALKAGEEVSLSFRLSDVLLKQGVYLIGVWMGRREPDEDIDGITSALSFRAEPNLNAAPEAMRFPAPYMCRFSFHVDRSESNAISG